MWSHKSQSPGLSASNNIAFTVFQNAEVFGYKPRLAHGLPMLSCKDEDSDRMEINSRKSYRATKVVAAIRIAPIRWRSCLPSKKESRWSAKTLHLLRRDSSRAIGVRWWLA